MLSHVQCNPKCNDQFFFIYLYTMICEKKAATTKIQTKKNKTDSRNSNERINECRSMSVDGQNDQIVTVFSQFN